MNLNKRFTQDDLYEFVGYMRDLQRQIGFKVSSRGWGYILEQAGVITKDQFGKVEGLVNRCRKEGLLPVDFVAEEISRKFVEIHKPEDQSYKEYIVSWLAASLTCDTLYVPNWWEGEEYYIQMVVEKIDLVTLFQPICRAYHIPIGNAKGWSSILQRADYARRFREAEKDGHKCVLLYCGDHDPDGLRISDTLRKNLEDVQSVYWNDGSEGYFPSDLIIDRFGLDYEFIVSANLTWIDNLITGSGKNLADPNHKNHYMEYLQDYLRDVGVRKCEANAVVTQPNLGRRLCSDAIQKYLGHDALDRFKERKEETKTAIREIMHDVGVDDAIQEAIDKLDNE